ncbi:hypothetical protein WOLCODRAFT_159439 [Wolfiporia cocos MD-104 SS10]|uniref:Uncharacterized protein n=1 Tax=Wolfiporia cocos (strain MD-104) TaxID=742152 RepID=A0A2H3IY84_WOLCO|nr:hypothetical protein WOLCODRAFT_159439 [Wolfiporia cocos MD-104 SS10]
MRPDRPCQGSARVSASKREVSQHLPGRRPCNQPRTAAPPALPTAPLDWTTPSCTLPRVPARQGGPTRGGSPLRPRPSSGQRRKHLGSKRNGAHRPPWNKTRQLTSRVFTQRARRHHPPQQLGPPALLRANNQAPPSIIDPRGNPARAIIERGAASAHAIQAAQALGCEQPHQGRWTSESKRAPRRTPPAATRPRSTVAHQRKAIRQGQPPESIQTQPQATVTSPPAYLTQGRAKAHDRQGDPPRTKSNGSADCLNNRATPSADRALTGRAAGTPQGSEEARGAEHTNTLLGPTACRTNGNDQAPRTGQPPPSKGVPRHRPGPPRHRHPGATL